MEKNKIKNPMVNINTRVVDSILLWLLCIGIFCSNLSSTHFCGLFNINANPIPRRKGNSIVNINRMARLMSLNLFNIVKNKIAIMKDVE